MRKLRLREVKYAFQDYTRDNLGCWRDHKEIYLKVQLWSHILTWFEAQFCLELAGLLVQVLQFQHS